MAVGGEEEGTQYVQRLMGMLEKGLQQQGTVVEAQNGVVSH